MKGFKIKLYIHWREEKPVCCCFPENKCSKDHCCELSDAYLEQFADLEGCMSHDAYKRDKHGVKQVRHG